jgi:hypothetical protein
LEERSRMAKHKRATALFEVMSKGRLAGGKSAPTPGGGIPTPKWWFNSKNRSGTRVEAPEEPADIAEQEIDDTDLPPVEEPAVHHETAHAEMNEPADESFGMRPQPVALTVDKEKQLISVRLSYTSALIGGFGLFIALALAVLIGKSLTRGPAPAIANVNTDELRKGPATPGVMKVSRRNEATGSNDAVEGQRPNGGNTSTGTRNPQNLSEPRPPATFFSEDPHRQNGLNYVIIQSYPDRESADKAAKFLTENGIGCSVERNLPNWPLAAWPNGCVVVGYRGYPKVSNNPSLEAYKKSIMDLSIKYTNGRSRFAGFSPSMYLWKKSN